ncbi:hypothetical protein [Emticicia agri]|uniref:Outer membrane protein beta-barrel domain-containing protein n=1 Tax=Emticicia agri TaxID=2492393 RepID=A0A4Q5M547_9BACT|nr:hypothetical protein [Emticicia agri]RYU97365.1 hypothetical protein EWM59_01360 [Emticicia agri]
MKKYIYCCWLIMFMVVPTMTNAQTSSGSKPLPKKKPATTSKPNAEKKVSNSGGSSGQSLPNKPNADKKVTSNGSGNSVQSLPKKPNTDKRVSANSSSSSAQSLPNKSNADKKVSNTGSSGSVNSQSAVSTTDTKTARPNQSNDNKSATQTKVAHPVQTVQPKSEPVRKYETSSSKRSNFASGGGYAKGDNLLNVGIGLSSYYYGNPIGISFEKGIEKDLSIGGQFDYNSGSYYGYSSGYKAYYLGARGSIHLCRLLKINVDKLDLYAGLGLGYRHFRWNDSYYGNNGGLFFNYFIGGKYYFTEKFGGFTELGYTGLSSVRVGLALKF